MGFFKCSVFNLECSVCSTFRIVLILRLPKWYQIVTSHYKRIRLWWKRICIDNAVTLFGVLSQAQLWVAYSTVSLQLQLYIRPLNNPNLTFPTIESKGWKSPRKLWAIYSETLLNSPWAFQNCLWCILCIFQQLSIIKSLVDAFCVIWIRSVYAKGSNEKFELKDPIRKLSKFGLWGLKIGLQLGFESVKWRKIVYFDLEKVWTFRVSILVGGV